MPNLIGYLWSKWTNHTAYIVYLQWRPLCFRAKLSFFRQIKFVYFPGSKMVQAYVKLSQSNGVLEEYAMIELQGDLESKQNLGLADNFIGDLHFAKDDTPVLIIGHHILYGKCVSLDKPLAVMKKSQASGSNHSSSSPTKYLLQTVVKKKLIFKTRPKPIIVNLPKKI